MPGRFHTDPVERTRRQLAEEIELHDNAHREALRDLHAAAGQANTAEMQDLREYAEECRRDAERCRSELASLNMCFL